MGLGGGDLPAHDRTAYLNELPAEVEITPLQPQQFALSHAGAHRAEKQGIEEAGGLLRLVADDPDFLSR